MKKTQMLGRPTLWPKQVLQGGDCRLSPLLPAGVTKNLAQTAHVMSKGMQCASARSKAGQSCVGYHSQP